MHLVSNDDQTVRIGGQRILIARDESIWTESCHKYDLAQLRSMGRQAAMKVDDVWVDDENKFSVQIMSLS